MSAKILFVLHAASRNGASIVLLNFLKWLRTNSDFTFYVLFLKGGALESEFRELATVEIFNVNSKQNNLAQRLLNKLNRKYKGGTSSQLSFLKEKKIDLVYLNTVATTQVLGYVYSLGCPIISHIHELGWAIERHSGKEGFEKIKNYTTQYIAVSQVVKDNLITHHSIPENKIDIIYESIPKISDDFSLTKDKIFQHLNIPNNSFMICASGFTNWRKGVDLFPQLAKLVEQRWELEEPVHFVWVGGQTSEKLTDVWFDIKKLGLAKKVHLIGEQPNPLEYFASSDIFTLLSREDPFPLVCLEAASLGKPILCFNDSGGMPEFVEQDAGFVVPYLDLVGMAEKIITLAQDKRLRNQLGNRAQEKVLTRHEISTSAPQILEVISRYL